MVLFKFLKERLPLLPKTALPRPKSEYFLDLPKNSVSSQNPYFCQPALLLCRSIFPSFQISTNDVITDADGTLLHGRYPDGSAVTEDQEPEKAEAWSKKEKRKAPRESNAAAPEPAARAASSTSKIKPIVINEGRPRAKGKAKSSGSKHPPGYPLGGGRVRPLG